LVFIRLLVAFCGAWCCLAIARAVWTTSKDGACNNDN
jgi:hypothetical protein